MISGEGLLNVAGVCCSVLQCDAARCGVLQCDTILVQTYDCGSQSAEGRLGLSTTHCCIGVLCVTGWKRVTVGISLSLYMVSLEDFKLIKNRQLEWSQHGNGMWFSVG